MCTVTTINKDDKFFITSNRDEEPSRNALALHESFSLLGDKILFPREPSHGGSWIALSEKGNAACLLNGAFSPYKHRDDYRLSRGIMLLKSFDYETSEEFTKAFNFDGIAPFTLVLYNNDILHELIWDGMDMHFSELIEDHNIWSSVQLYKSATRIDKKERFENWASKSSDISKEELIAFHLEGHPDFLIENEHVKTVSVTCLDTGKNGASILHRDLIEGREFSFEF